MMLRFNPDLGSTHLPIRDGAIGRRPQGFRRFVLIIVILLALSSSVILAQTGEGFELSWRTVDSGGGASTGGSFALSGTIGQPDAGTVSGSYILQGGFWGDVPASSNLSLYLPILSRDS